MASNPNPPKGKRRTFRKLTLTLPPETLRILRREAQRRRAAGEPNRKLTEVTRELLEHGIRIGFPK